MGKLANLKKTVDSKNKPQRVYNASDLWRQMKANKREQALKTIPEVIF